MASRSIAASRWLFARPLCSRPARPTAAPAASRRFGSTPRVLGLDEFFDSPQGWLWHKDLVNFGRGWTHGELRRKSFEDLHKLWFVCLKERNRLASQKDEARRFGKSVPDRNAARDKAARKTMAGIKLVLWERYLTYKDMRSVFDKAAAIDAAAAGGSTVVDPDVATTVERRLKSYEEREKRQKYADMGLADQLPRKPKLLPKRTRKERLGPVLIDVDLVIKRAKKAGFGGVTSDKSLLSEAVAQSADGTEGESEENAAPAPEEMPTKPR
ncbi:mitochondrial 39-S ribosomal protein L47 (MRP-L47)-domain-containing protein [Hyaloraphidium curvatum]|nr:mitochondrial 39-S ribosomal protein L47 (MRP-L47)-domain-containing protein [Hyaloraphidium curvatum]